MVNNSSISTTQSLDRLVGTAAIIGLSLAVVLQWLTADENDVLSEEGSNNPQQQEYESGTAAAAASSPSRRKIIDGNSKKATWWWPLTILQRRKKKRRKRQNNKHHENNNPRNIDGSCCNNTNEGSSSCGDDGYCDHLGSCECGSIRFIVSIYIIFLSRYSTDYTFQFMHNSRLTIKYAYIVCLYKQTAQGTKTPSTHPITG